MTNVTKQLRIFYTRIITSIAFMPAIIAVGFLFLSWAMLELDFSEFGKHIKSNAGWLSLKDASTARSIISTVAGAVLSLTVFSFSMVMIVLNQAASQMSNRVLTSMIQNRFQQVILGFYIGTIVYALFLLSTIRDISSGIYVPSLSVYLLIIFTVIDIFLFIYFLDYVTKTVKYETVIKRIQDKTHHSISGTFKEGAIFNEGTSSLPFSAIKAPHSNYFQGFNEKALLQIAAENDIYFHFMYKRSTHIVSGNIFLRVYCKETIDDAKVKEILGAVDFYNGQPITRNADYGFMQLAEVALKALSPGINDPATAVISLNALADILAKRLYSTLPQTIYDDKGTARIYCPATTFEDIFNKCIVPIWHYGKEDPYIQSEMPLVLNQLKEADQRKKYTKLFDDLLVKIKTVNGVSDA